MQLDLQATLVRALAGRYAVTRELGRGGMAVVYLAHDLARDQDVAIKLLYPDLARAVGGERFLREIRILQQLSHPNILPLLDSGTIELLPGLDLPWYAMPLARDETLRARLTREGALPLAVAIGYIRDLCEGLNHAHSQGIIHRDIKPENILLVDGKAVLADFGVARAVTLAGSEKLSSTGIVVGTPAYMSPEQSVGSVQLDGRSDLYSLGVVLYEMLAGHPPFAGSTPQAVSARHQFEVPPPIAVVRPAVPPGLEAVLTRALAKVAADRYQSATELSADLEGHREPVKRRVRPGLLLTLAAGVMIAIGAVGLIPKVKGKPLSDRIAVVPFLYKGPADGLVSGSDAAMMISDALAEYHDLARVDRLTVQNAIAVHGEPKSLNESAELARQLGAGKLIWGQVYQVGDSLRVLANLYRVTRNGQEGIVERTRTIPAASSIAGGSAGLAEYVVRTFTELARELVLEKSDAAPELAGYSRTTSYGALKANSTADSALAEWNLPFAREQYQASLGFDPGYARAQLGLASLDQLVEAPSAQWRPGIVAALRSGVLDSISHQRATALLALADGDTQAACDIQRGLLAGDSLDFRAWIGLGDCLTNDEVLVRRGNQGPAFRTSLNEAANAYVTALRVLPLAHRASRAAILPRLYRVLPNSQSLRSGHLDGFPDSNYVAWIGYAGDSMAFAPIPYSRLMDGTAPMPPAVAESAFRANSIRLRQIVEGWTVTFPSSGPAWSARATVLEKIGIVANDTSALAAIRRARQLTTDSAALLEILIDETGIALKSGEIELAARTARDVLRRKATDPVMALHLAPLAALLGDEPLLITLLRQGASAWRFSSPTGERIEAPPGLAADALAYYGYAVMGQSPDSIRNLARRVTSAITAWAPRDRRAAATLALTQDASYYAFAVVGAGPAHAIPGHESSLEQQLLSSGTDHAASRSDIRRRAVRIDSLSVVDVSPESALEIARELLLLGDTAAAITTADRVLGALGLQQHLLRFPQAPSAVVRLAQLRVRLKTPAPSSTVVSLAHLWP